MKYLIHISLLFISIYCNSQELSHSEARIVVPSDAVNGDYVTHITAFPTVKDTTGNSISYSEYNDIDDICSINSSTGEVLINDYTNLSIGTSLYIFQTTNGSQTDIDTLTIEVKSSSDCYYIEPGTSGSGTRASPFSWSDVTSFTAGKAYLQKCATTQTSIVSLDDDDDGTSENHIVLGSYGTGYRPIIDPASGPCMSLGSYNAGADEGTLYVDIYNFRIQGGEGILGEAGCKYIRHYNIDVYDCSDNGQIYYKRSLEPPYDDQYMGLEFINCISDSTNSYPTQYHCYKIETGAYFLGCEASRAGGKGYSVGSQSTLKYCMSKNASTGNLEAQGDSILIQYCIASGGTDAVITTNYDGHGDTQADYIRVLDSYFYNSDYTVEINGCNKCYFQRNTIINSTTHGVFLGYEGVNDSVYIERNWIENSEYDGIRSNPQSGNDTYIFIHYNIIIDCNNQASSDAIDLRDITNAFIYNNTCYNNTNGIEIETGMTGIIARNNFANTFTNINTVSNNIDIDTITDSNYWTDAASDDFTTFEGAYGINNGYDVGLSSDYLLNPIIGLPDIGAYEFGEQNRKYPYKKGIQKKFFKGVEKKLYKTK
jgi:hypothetical protein